MAVGCDDVQGKEKWDSGKNRNVSIKKIMVGGGRLCVCTWGAGAQRDWEN